MLSPLLFASIRLVLVLIVAAGVAGGIARAAAQTALPNLDRVLQAIEDETWPWARKLARDTGDPVVVDYVSWRGLRARDDVDFAELRAFIETHEDWPGLDALQRRAEARLDETVPYVERRAFFARRAPQTRQGRTRLAEAHLAAGDAAAAASIARRSWIDDDFPTGEERYFLALFGGYLRPEDNAVRLDRLLWDGKVQGARAMLDAVDEGKRRLAIARIALQTSAPGVDRMIERVPAELNDDGGLAFDRLQWRKHKGRIDGVREILLAPPARLGRAEAWWSDRAYEVRELIDGRRFDDAYALARLHGQPSGVAAAEALFLEGWLALRFVDRPREALSAFERLHGLVASPISRARAAYWAGRAASALGEPNQARRWFEAAARHGTTFYGQLAADAIGRPLRLPATATVPLAAKAPPLARLAASLCRAGATNEARPFLRHLLIGGVAPEAVVGIAATCKDPSLLVEIGKAGVAAGVAHPVWSYPLLPDLDPDDVGHEERLALVLAVARQESHFDAKARSHVGAGGLMQLMPGTAKAMARRLNIPYDAARLTTDAAYNLMLGDIYLAGLDERYAGAPALMAAAYNAGPGRVSAWLERHGDPRGVDVETMVDWIELIPYRETRNYVQRIIEGQRVYVVLLDPDRIPAELEPDRALATLLTPKPKPQVATTVLLPSPPAPRSTG